MKTDSKLSRLVFTSPWLLLVFLVIPLLVFLSVSFHVRLPFASTTYPLLFNNSCFSLVIALRFLYYLSGMTKVVRYGSCYGVPRQSLEIARPAGTIFSSMVRSGYIFVTGGDYGEKRDLGYTGTMILYAGLFVVLSTGTIDNMRQFSGKLLDGVGASTDLNRTEVYRHFTTGPLTSKLTTLPTMKIIRQIIPDTTYPRGAAEIAFHSADGKDSTAVITASNPFRAGPYDIFMTKLVFEPWIAITIDDSTPVFSGQTMLNQLETKVDGYSFYGTFVEGLIDGKVYYQPEKSRLKVVLYHGDQLLMKTEQIFQHDRLSKSANFTTVCEKMGVWSEIYVVRRRHMPVIFLGGVLALIGLVMRVTIRPQRVWLEETPEGCRVRVVGKEAIRLLKDEG